MAIPHAKPAEIIDIRPFGEALKTRSTTTLVKTDSLQVIRLVLPAGKEIDPHTVLGEITVQCLEGKVVFRAKGTELELTAGNLIYLDGAEEHSVRAVEDASVLLTILLRNKA